MGVPWIQGRITPLPCSTAFRRALQGFAFFQFGHVRPAADFFKRPPTAYADIGLIQTADAHAGRSRRIIHAGTR